MRVYHAKVPAVGEELVDLKILPAHHQYIAIQPRAVELSERVFIKLAHIDAFSDSADLRCIAMNLQHVEILH